MKRALRRAWLIGSLGAGCATGAEGTRAQATPHAAGTEAELRAWHAHFGVGVAQRLLRSGDAEDRLVGIARAATLGTDEATTLLANALEVSPLTGRDLRPLVALARGLSAHAEVPAAPLGVGPHRRVAPVARDPRDDVLAALSGDAFGDDARAGLLDMARDIAALGLARSGAVDAVQALFGLVRSGGAGGSADAAARALLAFPPVVPPEAWAAAPRTDADASASAKMVASVAAMTPPLATLLGRLGDLRALGVLREASASPDLEARGAALVARATLGDATALVEAEAARASLAAPMRVAAAEALVVAGAASAGAAVERLLASEETTEAGIRLAARVQSPALVRALATRTMTVSDFAQRGAAVAAIGHQGGDEAVAALTALAHDPALGGDAAEALARLPGPRAREALRALARERDPQVQRLALRAYGLRVMVLAPTTPAEKDAELGALAARLAASKDGATRALGTWVRALHEGADGAGWLDDPDPRVRRAAAMVSRKPSALAARWQREEDPLTREVLTAGWVDTSFSDAVPTETLLARALAGGPDAALAAYALAARPTVAGAPVGETVARLLAGADPILRAHIARGLARSLREAATGALAEAYLFETDAAVRLSIVLALAARAASTALPPPPANLTTTLGLAMRLDPDAAVRAAAGRASTGREPRAGASAGLPQGGDEAVWVRLLGTGGRPPPAGAGGASLLRADGFATPIAFDDDGYAVVPWVPRGGARLVLAPRLPASYAGAEP